MTRENLKSFIYIALAMWSSATAFANTNTQATDSIGTAAKTVVIAPLFEYPIAPENLENLRSRTNWIMQNFWNSMDFKTKKTVDQNALNDAFNVYTSSMPYADKEIVERSADDLIKKLRKNPVLLYQFTRAAEERLYGPRADFWIDDVYIKFLRALVENKKIDQNRKLRYADQLRRMEGSMKDHKLASFTFTDRKGNKQEFSYTAPYTLIQFGNPECDECRTAKNLLEIDLGFNRMLDDKKVAMAFIIADDDPDGELISQTMRYPEEWTVGVAPDAIEDIDIRESPSFFIVDGNGIVKAKNVTVNQALLILQQFAAQDDNSTEKTE